MNGYQRWAAGGLNSYIQQASMDGAGNLNTLSHTYCMEYGMVWYGIVLLGYRKSITQGFLSIQWKAKGHDGVSFFLIIDSHLLFYGLPMVLIAMQWDGIESMQCNAMQCIGKAWDGMQWIGMKCRMIHL